MPLVSTKDFGRCQVRWMVLEAFNVYNLETVQEL